MKFFHFLCAFLVVNALALLLGGGQTHAITWTQGAKSVAVAGTAEQLNTNYSIQYCVVVKAIHTNAGLVYLADTQTRAQTANQRFILQAGQSLKLCVDNLNKIWVNTTVNAEGVEYAVEIP